MNRLVARRTRKDTSGNCALERCYLRAGIQSAVQHLRSTAAPQLTAYQRSERLAGDRELLASGESAEPTELPCSPTLLAPCGSHQKVLDRGKCGD